MSENSVIQQIKELRKDLDKETHLLNKQMELPFKQRSSKRYAHSR